MRKFAGIIIGLLFVTVSMAQEQIDFRVDVPSSWKLEEYSEEDRMWAYESADGNHRLTVSVLYYSNEPTHAQQGMFLDDFIKTRQEQSAVIDKETTFSKTKLDEYETAWVARFTEVSPSGRYATNKAISSRIGIANFYLESLSSGEDHENVSKKVLSTTGFAS